MMEGFVLHEIFDYLRAVAYATIILTDLRNIFNRRFNNVLLVGDIIMAFALMISALNLSMGKIHDQELLVDLVLTPAAIIWATIHFRSFLKNGVA